MKSAFTAIKCRSDTMQGNISRVNKNVIDGIMSPVSISPELWHHPNPGKLRFELCNQKAAVALLICFTCQTPTLTLGNSFANCLLAHKNAANTSVRFPP